MLRSIEKSMKRNVLLNMIYMDNDGEITQRCIKVLKVNSNSFHAYCFLRRSRRTFKMDNVLSFVPVVNKKGMVV